ncbi:MAG: hypothetical protein HYY46_08575 [Deltaproteobacteria bacterium]|nr:hypothetical protein [Deltaproteobacteria bacterium]
MGTDNKPIGSGFMIFLLILLVAGMTASGLWVTQGLNWILTALFLLVFMIVLGIRVCGRPAGILINERNLMSLSRFQIVVWTLLILSAYLTMALSRVAAGGISDPLAIELDWRLWALLGISTTSLVGTPLILSTKKVKTPANAEAVTKKAAAELKQPEAEIQENIEGTLYGNPSPADARFSDMFEGEEIKNTAYIDMAKVQMFFFTLVAAVSYAVLLFQMIATKSPQELASFPILPDGLIAILGISHAGYLGNKIVDHTQTA